MQALAEVTAELERLGVPERDPLEHLEAVLHADAYDAAWWALAVQMRVDAGEPLTSTNSKGDEILHPFVQAKNQALARWSNTSKRALDAGVAERRVQIAEAEARFQVEQIGATFEELGLSPELQQQATQVLARRLRQGTLTAGSGS